MADKFSFEFAPPQEETFDFQMPPKQKEPQQWAPSDTRTSGIGQVAKDFFGGAEAGLRLPWNVFGAGVGAGGIGALYGAIKGQSFDSALENMRKFSEKATIPALTESGKLADEAFGEGYETVKRDVFTEGLLAFDKEEWKNLKDLTPQKIGELEGGRRSFYEGLFDALMFGGTIKSAVGKLGKGKPKETTPTEPVPKPEPVIGPAGTAKPFDFQFEGGQEPVGGTSDIAGPLQDRAGVAPLIAEKPLELFTTGQWTRPPEMVAHAQGEPPIPFETRPGELLKAAETPGFQRSAEEAMKARELEKSTKLNPTENYETPTGEARLREKQAYDEAKGSYEKMAPVLERDVTPLSAETVQRAEDQVSRSPQAKYSEYIPVELARELRTYDRLTNPKTPAQFLKMEKSVMESGLNHALEFTYSIPDQKIVQTNGHTRVASAVKHGLSEIPAYVKVSDKPFIGDEAKMSMNTPRTPDLTGKKFVKFSELGYADARPVAPPAGRPRVPLKQRGAIGDWTREKKLPVEDAWKRLVGELQGITIHTNNLKEAIQDLKNKPHGFDESINIYTALSDGNYSEKAKIAAWDLHLAIARAEQPTAKILPFVPRSQRGAIGDWDARQMRLDPIEEVKKAISKQGAVESVKEALHQFDVDRRTMPELIESLVPGLSKLPKEWRRGEDGSAFEIPRTEKLTPEQQTAVSKIQDISDTFLKGSNVLIDKTISILTQNKTGAGQILKWLVDHRRQITLASESRIEGALMGTKFGPGTGIKKLLGRGFDRRMWGEDGVFTHWNKLKPAEARDMMDAWWSGVGKDVIPTFKSDTAKKTFDTAQARFEDARIYVNEKRAEFGLPPLAKLPNFFPGMRMGDYRLVVRDGAGKVVRNEGFTNIYQAKWAARELRKDPSVKELGLSVEDPFHIDKTKYDIAQTEMFEEALRVMSENDPATRVLQQAFSRLQGRRGAGAHSLMRKGTLGAMGMEPGELGVANSKKALEYYLKKLYNHGANLEKSLLYKELIEMPLEVRKQLPNTLELGKEYLDIARGADLDRIKFVTSFAEYLPKQAGFGASGFRRLTSEMSGYLTVSWLATTKFITQQPAQVFNAWARTVKEFGVLKGAESIFAGIAKALVPDKGAIEGVNWAVRKGHMTPAIVELVSLKMADMITPGSQALRKATGATLGLVERECVRIPAFLAFEHGLRDVLKDPEARYERAAELMDYYMVHYDAESTPRIYNKLGAVGDVAKPMKQYSHNAWGQFFEYAGDAKKGEIAPLAAFMGTQTLLAGLRGTVLLAEAGVAITVANLILEQSGIDFHMQTPDEFFVTGGIGKMLEKAGVSLDTATKTGDFLTYGGMSTLSGQDLSRSIGAPDMPGMFSLPVAQFVGKPMMSYLKYWMHKMGGVDTEADAMQAMKDLSPQAGQAWVDELFATGTLSTGGVEFPVPIPSDKMRHNYVRSANEQLLNKWFGGKSIDESKANALARYAKQDLMNLANKKMGVLNAMADRVVNGQDLSEDLVQKYVEQGGDIKSLNQNLKAAIKANELDYFQRQESIRTKSPAQAKKLDTIKEELDAKHRLDQERMLRRQSSEDVPKKKHYEPRDLKEMAKNLPPDERGAFIKLYKQLRTQQGIHIPKEYDADPELTIEMTPENIQGVRQGGARKYR